MGVDQMGVDQMGEDQMGVDQMGRHQTAPFLFGMKIQCLFTY